MAEKKHCLNPGEREQPPSLIDLIQESTEEESNKRTATFVLESLTTAPSATTHLLDQKKWTGGKNKGREVKKKIHKRKSAWPTVGINI